MGILSMDRELIIQIKRWCYREWKSYEMFQKEKDVAALDFERQAEQIRKFRKYVFFSLKNLVQSLAVLCLQIAQI